MKKHFIDSALGMTDMEAFLAFQLAKQKVGLQTKEAAQIISMEKEQIIKKNGILDYYQVNQDLESSLGGLDNLKDWLTKREKSFQRKAKDFGLQEPKGILLVGVPGCGKSLTAKYLNNELQIEVPFNRRKWNHFIELKNCNENNLKNISVKFPLNVLCAVTGVSGSGKSTLVKKGLLPTLQKYLDGYFDRISHTHVLAGSLKQLSAIEYVDQNPIGKSSRSNPVTYLKAYDEIRNLYAEQNLSKLRGYKPSHFSFNVDGGRCEVCEGEGSITVEMQFMADVQLPCDSCKGKRFKAETLEVNFHSKSITDILEMTIDDALAFFLSHNENRMCKKIADKLQPLQEVGLGYVQLGQSSSTLSGGEAQRIKLASFLSIAKTTFQPTLFVFDEPTTGLHFHDIKKLMKSFNALIEKGHSILVIEHNLDVVKCADWIIDLGPEAGDIGGNVVFEGTPEDLVTSKASITGKYLKGKLN